MVDGNEQVAITLSSIEHRTRPKLSRRSEIEAMLERRLPRNTWGGARVGAERKSKSLGAK